MTFPKMVVHASVAGLYGGLVVALLLALGNPGSALRGGPGLLIVILAYTLASGLVWPLLYASLRFFARHPLRLPWLSLRYVVGFHAVNTAAILTAGWFMLSDNRAALGPHDAERLASGCLWLSLAWLVCAVITVVPRLRRRAWVQAAAGATAVAALIVAASGAITAPVSETLVTASSSLPVGASDAGVAPAGIPPIPRVPSDSRLPGAGGAAPAMRRAGSARRLILLNFDGADLDTILTMHAQGRLPAFSRFIREGANGRLVSLRPCVAPVTRTSLVTGMLPYRHGVRGSQALSILGREPWLGVTPAGIGFDVLLAPVLARRPLGASDRTTPALWEIGGRMGLAVDSAGWDTDLDAAARAMPGARPTGIADLLDPEALRLRDAESRALVAEVARAAAADDEVIGAMRHAAGEGEGPRIAAFSFPGLDRVAHVFLRYAHPADFGNVSGRDIDLYGPVLERYYQRIDAIVGESLAPGRSDTLVLVTSTHGIEPMTLGARFFKEVTSGGPWSGVHDRAPAGFLLALGPNIRPGRQFGKGSLADVVPSALYALGLPVARDSDGAILTGLFNEAYTSTHPVTVVRSYGRVD